MTFLPMHLPVISISYNIWMLQLLHPILHPTCNLFVCSLHPICLLLLGASGINFSKNVVLRFLCFIMMSWFPVWWFWVLEMWLAWAKSLICPCTSGCWLLAAGWSPTTLITTTWWLLVSCSYYYSTLLYCTLLLSSTLLHSTPLLS